MRLMLNLNALVVMLKSNALIVMKLDKIMFVIKNPNALIALKPSTLHQIIIMLKTNAPNTVSLQ